MHDPSIISVIRNNRYQALVFNARCAAPILAAALLRSGRELSGTTLSNASRHLMHRDIVAVQPVLLHQVHDVRSKGHSLTTFDTTRLPVELSG
jgi:hypothetical protein